MFKFVLSFVLVSVVLGLDKSYFKLTQDRYYISQVQLSFIQAYATCKRYGWTLATEKSRNETIAIDKVLTAESNLNRSHLLGGVRQNAGEFFPTWVWLDSGIDIDGAYTHWYGDLKPTGSNDCLVKLSLGSSYKGNWTSTSCTSLNYFICEASI